MDTVNQGSGDHFLDIDRMINEGLGGGRVTAQNGLIEETTTDTMDNGNPITDDGEMEDDKREIKPSAGNSGVEAEDRSEVSRKSDMD
ncbi:MAG: hypothetical protein JWM44_246 [Bacilli bacterium]|nr:hypothetical protein [Bacilli bacterium]